MGRSAYVRPGGECKHRPALRRESGSARAWTSARTSARRWTSPTSLIREHIPLAAIDAEERCLHLPGMLARVRSGALRGIDALVVEVEVDVSSGLPHTTTVGLPDGSVREAADRIR